MVKGLSHRDQNTHDQTIHSFKKIFHGHGHKLQKVTELAQKIKEGIEKISPFIQQNTQAVCPECKDVCCINKHGYYNYEDLIYIHALGLNPPDYKFVRNDTDPCQFLSEIGCSLERSIRPSGCNWYFCGSLLERMERSRDYQEFDDSLLEVVTLWMALMDEFAQVTTILNPPDSA